MHTISGTGKRGLRFVSPILLMIFFTGCPMNMPQIVTESESLPRVKVAHVQRIDLYESVDLIATTAYIDKSEIYAPASGYIIRIGAVQSENVSAGHFLFSLETREHKAISNDSLMKQQNISSLGIFKVDAPGNGYIKELFHQSGDYVTEGTLLCNFTRTDNLYFIAYVPFKYKKFIITGLNCGIMLPDSSVIPCTIDKSLNTVEPGSQSIQVLIKPANKINLPEGLNAIFKLPIRKLPDSQVLPVSAILSNETLDEFWVVEIIQDSLAVKIPVKKGIRKGNMVQIIDPVFKPTDKILIEGNYGLPDTTKVQIIDQE